MASGFSTDKTFTLLGIIKHVIEEETVFLRHYIGRVLDNRDEKNRGRLQVAVYELNWIKRDMAPWCNARYCGGLSTPEIGDWVEVYFLAGRPDSPVWLALPSEMKGNVPQGYVDEKTDVVHGCKKNGDAIVYDKDGKVYKIGDASERFVKGDTFKPEIDKDNAAMAQLQADFMAWIPVPGDGGAALKAVLAAGFLTKALGSYASILSDKVKGQ